VKVLVVIDESLERLKTDFVELYTLHAPDPNTPWPETLDAISLLLESGKIRAWGVSNFAAWQLVELNLLCDARKLARPAASQVLYNLLVRQLELEYFAFARRHPIHTAVYNPLAGGLLARAPAVGAAVPEGLRFKANALYRSRYWTRVMHERCAQLGEVARTEGLELVTLAYAWLAGRPGVDSILCGPGTVAHLDAAIDACAIVLSEAACARLDALHLDAQGTDARYAR
jgi:aryl-alcohol dehydrogenase-like predicted oxidoreductase